LAAWLRESRGVCAASVVRTPEERFRDLPGYPFPPRYLDADGMRLQVIV
jgi:hypothetical protein